MSQLLLDNLVGEVDQIEFDLLNLNFTFLTRIRNDTVNINSTTESFTSHAAIQWQGSFMLMVEDRLITVIEHLNAMSHPATHPASMITENTIRIWMIPAEKIKLANTQANANNYTHPTEHTLSEITDSATRVVFTIDESSKLANVDDNANNYIHPVTHELTDIEGLIDGDGFLIPQYKPFMYNDKSHSFFKEPNVSMASSNFIKDNVNFSDIVAYTGGGSFAQPELPFGLGFNTNLSHDGIFLFNNDSDTESVNIYSTQSKFSLKSDTPHETFAFGFDNTGMFGDEILSVEDGVTHLNTWGNNPPTERINKEGSIYNVIGFRATSTLINGLLFSEQRMFKEKSTLMHGSIEKATSFIRLMSDGRVKTYIVRLLSNQFQIYEPETTAYLPGVTRFYSDAYVYFEKPWVLSNIVFLVDYGTTTTHNFRVSYLRSTGSGFLSLAAINAPKTTAGDATEIIHDIKIEVYITGSSNNSTAPDESVFLLTLLTASAANNTSRIRIYTINTNTNTINLLQTLNFAYKFDAIGLVSVRVHNVFVTPSWYWTNVLFFYYNESFYFYTRPETGGTFVSKGTLAFVNNGYNLPGVNVYQIDTCPKFPDAPDYGTNFTVLMRSPTHIHIVNLAVVTYAFPGEYTFLFDRPTNWNAGYDSASTAGYSVTYEATQDFRLYKTIKYLLTSNLYNGDCDIIDFEQSGDSDKSFKRIQKIKSNGYGNESSVVVRPGVPHLNVKISTTGNNTYLKSDIAGLTMSGYSDDVDLSYSYFQLAKNTDLGFWMTSIVNKNITIVTSPYPKDPKVLFGYKLTGGGGMDFVVKYVGPGYPTGTRYSIKVDTPTAVGSGVNFPLSIIRTNGVVSPPGVLNMTYDDNTVLLGSTNQGDVWNYFGFSGDVFDLQTSTQLRSASGTVGKVIIIELNPNESVDLGFTPNVIIYRYLDDPDYLNYTSISIGFDNYVRMGQTTKQTDRPMTINGTVISFGGITHPIWAMITAADTHMEGESLLFTPPVGAPFCEIFNSYNFINNTTGEVNTLIPNDEIYLALPGQPDVHVTGPTVIPNPTNLSNPDVRYVYMTSVNQLIYNDSGIGTVQIDATPEAQLIAGALYGSYLPVAKVGFANGVVTEVVPYPSGDTYETEWLEYTLGQTLVLPNRFMVSRVFASMLIRPTGNSTGNSELNAATTQDGIVSTGLKISFSEQSITITSYPSQTYLIGSDVSGEIKLIVKRMF